MLHKSKIETEIHLQVTKHVIEEQTTKHGADLPSELEFSGGSGV